MSVDLTLPASSSPTIDPYKHLPDPLLPFALFVHVELGDGEEELARIEAACNSQTDGDDNVRRAPRHDFAGQPLRAALAEHLDNLIATRRFDPFYFVAVVDENWRETGLVIVTMDDGTGDDDDDDGGDHACRIDQLRVPAEEVGLILVNLQIANADWADYKEEYGGDDQGDNGDDDDDDQGPSTTEKPEDDPSTDKPFDSPQTDEEYSDGASSTLRNLDYYIGFFAVPGIDFETVMRELHPCWGPRVPTPELGCRPEGRVPAGSQAKAVARAKRTWPLRCRNNPRLYRGMFLIVDTPDYQENGVLLVKTDWDEKAGAHDKDQTTAELAALGEAAATDTQRLPFANATTMTLFNEIKAGYRPWKHTHHTFLAYAGPQTEYPAEYLAALDKSFKRRKSSSQRFLEKKVQYPRSSPTTDAAADDGPPVGLETALEQHWGFVHEERFCGTLCPEYFVYCDRELAAKDTGETVGLVRVGREAGDWSLFDCNAGDAYQVLCDIVDKKKEWPGQKDRFILDE
ncbi:hypothetical protein PG991_015207 [Apiospora marii]|uniref:DUF6924 domain-containing protein n=1 Tax=Apiospora marii TaxID=335849 RepID=A0ABR1R119_9PEZI